MTRRLVAASVVITASSCSPSRCRSALSYTSALRTASWPAWAGRPGVRRSRRGAHRAGDQRPSCIAARRLRRDTDLSRGRHRARPGSSLVDTAGPCQGLLSPPEIDTLLGYAGDRDHTSTTLDARDRLRVGAISSSARISPASSRSFIDRRMRSQIPRWNWARPRAAARPHARGCPVGSTVIPLGDGARVAARGRRPASSPQADKPHQRFDRGPPSSSACRRRSMRWRRPPDIVRFPSAGSSPDVSHRSALRSPSSGSASSRWTQSSTPPWTPTDCATRRRRRPREIERHPRRRGLLALTRADGSASSRDGGRRHPTAERRRTLGRARRGGDPWSSASARRATASEVPGGIDQILDNLLDQRDRRRSGGHRDRHHGLARPNRVSSVSVTGDRDSTRSPTEGRPRQFWRGPDAAPGGTGLGLAIVAELAPVSGGFDGAEGPCGRTRPAGQCAGPST